jgi:uncharacterized protein with NRDE domain
LKTNEREVKMSNMVHLTLTQEKWTTQRHIEKQNRTRFSPWYIGVIRVVGKSFHNNFEARFWMFHPLVYNGFNLGITSKHQQIAKQQRMEKCNLLDMFQQGWNHVFYKNIWKRWGGVCGGFWSIILMTIGDIGLSKGLDGKVFSGFCNMIMI